jgi:hypothetical protein
MGASSSISLDIPIDIYLSYAEETRFITELKCKLNLLNYHLIDSSLIQNSLSQLSIPEITILVEKNIHKANNIIICLSKKSIQSISNAIEMNELVKVNPNSNKYIYLMMENDYTPDTNSEILSIVKNGLWFPFYDEKTVEETMNKIYPLLSGEEEFTEEFTEKIDII